MATVLLLFFLRAHVCEKHSRKDQDCLAEEETPENVKINHYKILPAGLPYPVLLAYDPVVHQRKYATRP